MFWINGKPIEINLYPNNETLFRDAFWTPDGEESHIRWRWDGDVDFIRLAFIKRHLSDAIGNKRVVLWIDYMPYSRLDRAPDAHGDVFTLKYVCSFINDLKFDKVFVVEPHSDVTPALLDRSFVLSPMNELLNRATEGVEAVVVYPDAGAEKRYKHLTSLPSFVARKQRDFNTGRITSVTLDIDVQQVVILDDLCSKGGTFIPIAEELRAAGYDGTIVLVVAHLETNVFSGSLFDHVGGIYTTDSMARDLKYSWMIDTTPLTEIFTDYGGDHAPM